MLKQTSWAVVILAGMAMWTAPGFAQELPPRTFPSAAEASLNLFQAVQQNNEQEIRRILGASTELASSDNEAQDKVDRQRFVEKFQEMHRLGRDADGSMTLYIGAENWPFPIPVVAKDGMWRFDGDKGVKEILYRRIGDNELLAIDLCHELIAAQRRAHTSPQDSLRQDGVLASLLGKTEGGPSDRNAPIRIRGYYFRVLLTKSTAGSSGFIAYPAEYRSSGVMTFVVTPDDLVYEKDLGESTAVAAKAMASFRKDSTWLKTAD